VESRFLFQYPIRNTTTDTGQALTRDLAARSQKKLSVRYG